MLLELTPLVLTLLQDPPGHGLGSLSDWVFLVLNWWDDLGLIFSSVCNCSVVVDVLNLQVELILLTLLKTVLKKSFLTQMFITFILQDLKKYFFQKLQLNGTV